MEKDWRWDREIWIRWDVSSGIDVVEKVIDRDRSLLVVKSDIDDPEIGR